MVSIESNFIVKRDELPSSLEENKIYEIPIKKQVNYTFIGQLVPLWVNGLGSKEMGVDDIGKVRILEATHYKENNEVYTRVKFEVLSLKENGLGRKIQT